MMEQDNELNLPFEAAKKDLGEIGQDIHKRADGVRKDAVNVLHSAAEKIRDELRERELGEDANRAADEVAKGLDKAAEYLNTRSVEEMGQDAKQVVQQYPVRTVGIAVFIGIIVGMFMRGGGKR
ncbi:MAG TPA: hypothetical protein PLQ56_05820 [Aggregatilineales bacterium]|nr:hypothetical protein [Aggregatilineales bacterium]